MSDRVLVVDDDPALLGSLKVLLSFRLSIEAETCDSGRSALDRIRDVDFDAIICDIKMPQIDGLDLMKRVQEMRPSTPTLLMTGHGDHDLGVKALNAGAYAFIQKPIDRDFFLAWLQRAIQLRRLTRHVEEQNRVLHRQTEELERLVEHRTASLRESERRLAHALDATADGVWDWNIKTGEVLYSRRWIESLGYTPEEVPPHVSFRESLFHPDDAVDLREALRAHFEGGTDLYGVENRLRMKNGAYRWNLDQSKVVERDPDGKPLRLVGTDSDITARKEMEDALRESRERLRKALEFDEAVMANMGEGLYALDKEGLVTYVNQAAEALFGWARADLVGRKMHDIVHYKHRDGRPYPAQQCPGLQVLLQGKVLTGHRDTFIRRDGTFFNVTYSSSPIMSGQRIDGLVVVFREIGERDV